LLDGLKEEEGVVGLWGVICKSLDGAVGDLVSFNFFFQLFVFVGK